MRLRDALMLRLVMEFRTGRRYEVRRSAKRSLVVGPFYVRRGRP